MPGNQIDMADELLRIVTFALECVLNNDYKEEFNQDGNLMALELRRGWFEGQVDTHPQLLEDYFRRVLSPQQSEALYSLKERRTPEQIEEVFRLVSPISLSKTSRNPAVDLADADWHGILRYLNELFAVSRQIGKGAGYLIAKEREGFSSPFGTQLESYLEHRYPTNLDFLAAEKCVAEFGELLPKLVKRATAPEFRLLAASKNVPESVKRYLIEASRCYLFGDFLACLIVCRSAIEEAVKQRLKDIGKEADVEKDDRLVTLLRLARCGGLLDNKRLQMADGIRDIARKAVHGKRLPEERECIESFHQARGVLEHLYGRLQ